MSFNKRYLLLAFMVLLGMALRLLMTMWGHNYDFDSYLIVLRIIENGQNVYAETTRYNYGPIWFNGMWVLYKVAEYNVNVFRILLVLVLSVVDAVIFIIILKKYGALSGYFFYFNPISILITGYHNQFDNLAILLGLISVILLGNSLTEPLNKKKYLGLLVLGISLTAKHLLFLYPIWLAVKQKGAVNKLLVILIPTAIFLLSFIPYAENGLTGIIQNVFLYGSYENGVFYKFFLPLIFQIIFTSESFWLLTLIFFAYYFKDSNGIASLSYYLCILVVTSPAITNQYLAIPLILITTNINFLSILYTLFGAIHLITDIDGLHLFIGPEYAGTLRAFMYLTMVVLLTLYFARVLYKNSFRVKEKNQFAL